MKIFVLIVAIFSVVSVEAGLVYNGFEWSGNIKTLVDKANYKSDEVVKITKKIFKGMSMNCQGRIGRPSEAEIPSPSKHCDLEILDDLKKRLSTGYSDDYQEFLGKFWSSDVAKRFMKEMKKKGVKESVLKAALEEIWFTKSYEAGCPFNRIFLEADDGDRSNYKALNTWYTYEVDFRKTPEWNIVIHGKDLPVLVTGEYEGEELRRPSQFVFPSHPFVDLVVYSLCAWSQPGTYQTIRSCETVIPGSDKTFNLAVKTQTDPNHKGYLELAYYDEDF